MHHANSFLLCHPFLCRNDERTQFFSFSFFNGESVVLLVKILKLFT